MDENVYKVPESDLLTDAAGEEVEFYVVGKTKFALLFLSTFSLYSVYWFYRNWKLYKEKHDKDIWPVARGLFSIFFAHSLFKNVEQKLSDTQRSYSWNPESVATLYVVLSIASNVSDRLSNKEIGSPYTDVLVIAALPTMTYVLLKAQEAINISVGDPKGLSNSALTMANYLWILLGCVVWVLAVIGLLMIFGVISE